MLTTKQLPIYILLLLSLVFTQSACKSKRIQGTNKASSVLIGGYEKKDMHFRVQIAAFEESRATDDPYFNALGDVEIRQDISPKGLYRYSVGFFKNYEDADRYEQEVKSRGYEDAYVVAYGDDDKRIEMHMSKILELYKQAE